MRGRSPRLPSHTAQHRLPLDVQPNLVSHINDKMQQAYTTLWVEKQDKMSRPQPRQMYTDFQLFSSLDLAVNFQQSHI